MPAFHSFVPSRLIRTEKQVAALHPPAPEPDTLTGENTQLEPLIRHLVGLSPYQVRRHALALSREDALRIAAYLPHNYYLTPMDNLFLAFQVRSDAELCAMLYDQWQESYSNDECNRFLRDSLLVQDRGFCTWLKNCHLKADRFAEILYSGDIVGGFGLLLKEQPFPPKLPIAERLLFFGLRNSSRSGQECTFLFYAFCRRIDYLSVGQDALTGIIKNYQLPQLISFLHNFLEEMTLQDLTSFRNLAGILDRKTGNDPASATFKRYFSTLPSSLTGKYLDWINRFRIIQYFGKDLRSAFWTQYRFSRVYRFHASQSIIMEFGQHVAIEFLGQGMGPLYIFQRSYFNQHIRRWFISGNFDNAALRSRLYHESDYETHGYRKAHIGNWQAEVNKQLLQEGITELIFI